MILVNPPFARHEISENTNLQAPAVQADGSDVGVTQAQLERAISAPQIERLLSVPIITADPIAGRPPLSVAFLCRAKAAAGDPLTYSWYSEMAIYQTKPSRHTLTEERECILSNLRFRTE